MATDEYKSDYFSWKIEKQSEVRAFLAAKPTKHFSSEIFQIGVLQWQLYAYPSGKYRIRNDYNVTYPQEGCELHLKLLPRSWPRNVYKIIFAYRLFCSAANSSFTNLETFVRNPQNRYFVRWFRGTLTADELLALEGQIVNLECYINILKMESNNNQILYQYPFPADTLQKEYEFEWEINNIQGLFVNTKCGKHLESDIYQNFWCLRIAPRGWKLHEQRYVTAWLQLCALPMDVFKIYCKYTFRCKELNITFSKNKTFSYSYNGTNAPFNQRRLVTDSLRNLKGDTLTFQCKIIVLKTEYNRRYRGPQYEPQIVRKLKGAIGSVHNQKSKVTDVADHKSSEMDELRQEIQRLNKKVADLQSTVGIIMHKMNTNDDQKMNEGPGPGFDANGTMEPIEVWLRYSVKLPQYIQLFEQSGMDMGIMRSGTVNSDYLEILGINNKFDRAKIMEAITKLKEKYVTPFSDYI